MHSYTSLTALVAATAVQASSSSSSALVSLPRAFGSISSALAARQVSGDQYQCHANCGYTILGAEEEGYCEDPEWNSLLEACLACADEYGLWPDYGAGVEAAAEACGLEAVPIEEGEPSATATSTTASATSSTTAEAPPTTTASEEESSATTTSAPSTTTTATTETETSASASVSVTSTSSSSSSAYSTTTFASSTVHLSSSYAPYPTSAYPTVTPSPSHGNNGTNGTVPSPTTIPEGEAPVLKAGSSLALGVAGVVFAFGLLI